MDTYSFILLVRGADILAEEHADALFEAGCGDALFGERDGVQYADFDREADSFAHAVGSAIHAIEDTVPGAKVVRVEPDDVVTLTGIAARVDRTKESVRLLTIGRRGPGDFPAPLSWVAGKNALWQWSDVSEWFRTRLGEDLPASHSAAFVAALNGALEARWRLAEVREPDEREELARVLQEDLDLAVAA
jgi:hypothetical protein